MYREISTEFIESISRCQFSFSLVFPKEEKRYESSGQDTIICHVFNMSELEKAAVDVCVQGSCKVSLIVF